MQTGNVDRLDEVLQQTPLGTEIPKLREPLLGLARSLDGLGRLNEGSQQVFLHEMSLRALLRAHFPPEFEDRCVTGLGKLPGSKLIDTKDTVSHETMKAVPWRVVAAKAKGFAPTLDAAMEGLGLTASSSRSAA